MFWLRNGTFGRSEKRGKTKKGLEIFFARKDKRCLSRSCEDSILRFHDSKQTPARKKNRRVVLQDPRARGSQLVREGPPATAQFHKEGADRFERNSSLKPLSQ